LKWLSLTLAFWFALAVLFFYVYPYSKWLFAILLVGWVAAWIFVFKKTKHKTTFVLFFLFLIMSLWGILHLNPVQNWLVAKVSASLSKNLKAKVTVRHVDFSLFNKMLVEGVLVEDRKKDTLLYAGTVKVNITDWFFFKDKPVLKYVGLSDAVINMNRSDSVWNYQFLVDYFSSPKSKTNANKNALQIDLKVLELNNVVFNRIDKWIGQDFKASIKKLDLTADEIDLSKKIVAINDIKLNEPVFSISDYRGSKPFPDPNAVAPITVSDDGQLKWNAGGWQLHINKILLQDGSFMNDKETARAPYTDQFDGQHIKFTLINGELNNVLFVKDSITAVIKISTKEKSGFEVKQLTANMKVTPGMMEFNGLDITTEKSRIGNYYVMRYNNFNADMANFLHNIKLEGKFAGSHIHTDDIAFFAPTLKSWDRIIYFEGNARGSIDNLSADKLKVKSGNTIIDGDIALKGLPDIYNTFIDFKSNDLQTNYSDVVKLVPSLKNIGQPQLSRLGDIRFRGNFTGFIKDFVAYGNIYTSLGNLNADLNMKLRDNQVPTYSGNISSAGFNLGSFFNNKQLGKVALSGQVKGRGFNLRDLNADFNGKVSQLEFSGYTYQNIKLDGTFIKNLFNGHLDIDDPNLKIENLNGSISLLGDTTQFNFDADLKKANLQKLHLTKEDFNLSGLLKLNFAGNNIDNFLGTAKIYDATLKHDSTRLSFDSLTLNSLIAGDKKLLTVQSNEIEGSLTGDFKILQLPDAFKMFLNRYYPTYIEKPTNNISDQDFSFYIKTREVDEYVKLFDKRLSGFDNSVFSGNLKLAKNEFNVQAEVPQFGYDGKTFTNIQLTGKGNLDSLNTNISVSDVSLSDSLHFPNTRLTLSSKNDISNIQLTTSASNTLSNAQLNARVQTYADGVKVHFFPSSFILNEKKWSLAKDGELTLRKSYIEANDVRFTQGEQEIVLSTELDELTDHTNLVAKMKKVNINDVTQPFLKQPRFEGLVTGTVKLKDPFGKQVIEYDVKAEDFRLDNEKIGTVNAKGEANTTTGLIKFKADADGELYKFNMDGSYNYKDSSENQMDIAFLAERFDIGMLNNYLGTIFSDMHGNANSNLKLSGGKNHPYFTGSVTVTEGALKVKYTQVKYKFNNETIIFNPDEIDLGTLQLKDTLNNTGTVSGKMHHVAFNDFGFDNLRFETNKMLLLNTTSKDNNQFYGKVIGKALMTLDGPVTDMKMNITGEPSALDSSHIYIPSSTSQEIEKINYIDFIQYGSKMEDEFRGRKETNFLVNMDLKANPACKIDVILDEATGDVIKGRGNGLLNIRVGTKEPLTIRGRYNIVDGEYKFNFQTWLQKYFTINQGSITWNGDPYLAQINIDAEYLAKRVDLSNLSSSTKQKENVTIIAHLTGVLNKPVISFDFQLQPNSEVSKNFVALNRLEAIKNDDNEMNKQVASLLLFNTFISPDQNQGLLSGGNTIGLATNTIGGIISGWLANTFNKELEKATNGVVSTYFDINSSLDLQNKAALLQANLSAGIKLVLSSRLVVLIGGNLDYNNPYAQLNKKGLLTPDINIEWSLNKDGSLKVVGFNRTSIDLAQGQRNRSGVKLSYRKDFDRISEILAPNEERRKKHLVNEVKE
jgi:hypothetical protein